MLALSASCDLPRIHPTRSNTETSTMKTERDRLIEQFARGELSEANVEMALDDIEASAEQRGYRRGVEACAQLAESLKGTGMRGNVVVDIDEELRALLPVEPKGTP